MKTLLAILTLCVVLLGGAMTAQAGNTIGDYESFKDGGGKSLTFSELDLMDIRLLGAYEAIGWVNVLYVQEKKPPVFCPPDEYVITVKDLREMLDAEIRDHNFSTQPYPKDMPMEAIVMFASMTRFPCR